MSDAHDVMKTGTTTIGVVCKEGIVLAADKRATAGNYIVNKTCDKIFLITPDMALTMAGTVSDAQLLVKLISAETKLKEIRTGQKPTVRETASLLGSMVYYNIRKMSMIPGISHFVLGGKDARGFALYDIFADGSVVAVEDFISSGSGSVVAYGLLETMYDKNMSLQDAMELVVKSISAAIQRDSASGGGVDVLTITKDGAHLVVHKLLDTRLRI